MKTLFIATIFNLEISSPLGKGIQVTKNLYLTNDSKFIDSLITEEIVKAVGMLETLAIINNRAVLYSIQTNKITPSNADNILIDYLAECRLFLQDLWMVKDNGAAIMLGFIQFPFIDPTSLIISPYQSPTVNSNMLTGFPYIASGELNKRITFSLEELTEILELIKQQNSEMVPFSTTTNDPSLLTKGKSRLTLAHMLIQIARSQNDLGLKIGFYCTALEGLFATETTELSHKLSERVAVFLGETPESKLEIFKLVKTMYGIRSKVFHGALLKVGKDKLVQTSISSDDLLRKILVKLYKEPELDSLFRTDKTVGFNEYFNNLIFGLEK